MDTPTLTFAAALTQAEAQARSTLDVALHERLSCAVALVKDGAVFQANDRTWTVASRSTPGKEYSPNGTCSCADVHYNKPRWCKHALAMFLAQRTMTLMRQPPAPVVPEVVEPVPAQQPVHVAQEPVQQALPEAPASVNVRLMIDGRDCQLTLRGVSEEDVLLRLERILGRYPVQAPASSQGQPQDAAPQCPQHGALRQGKRGWYCPRQLADGTWCKSRST